MSGSEVNLKGSIHNGMGDGGILSLYLIIFL